MNKISLLFFILIFFTGCTSSKPLMLSGVVCLGDDAYQMTRSETGFNTGPVSTKAHAIKEADQFCSEAGNKLEIVQIIQKPVEVPEFDAKTIIKFKCI